MPFEIKRITYLLEDGNIVLLLESPTAIEKWLELEDLIPNKLKELGIKLAPPTKDNGGLP